VGGVHLEIAHRIPLGPLSAIVFLAVAIGVAVLTLRRPAFGIAALVVLDPLGYAHDIGPTQITLSKVALLGVLIALVARRTSLAPLRYAGSRSLVFGIVAIVCVTALSAIPATFADAVARETLKALEYALVFGVASVAIESEDDEDVFRTGVLAATAVVCASALAELVTGAPSGALIAGRAVPRIAGFLEGPNQLAGYLDLATPLLVASVLARDRFRVPSAALLAVAVVTDVLTLSRGGAFGIVAGIAFTLAFRTRGTRFSARFVVVALGLCAGLAALATRLGFAKRFFSIDEVARDNGLGTRAELWRAAIALWRTDPGLGVGAGNFERLLPSAGLIGVRTHANDLYLQSLAEGGVALFSAVAWTIVSAIATCVRDAPRSVLLLGVAAATFGFAAHQVFDVLTFFPKVGGFWYLLLGAAAGRACALENAVET
jgi:O-antigen ligase